MIDDFEELSQLSCASTFMLKAKYQVLENTILRRNEGIEVKGSDFCEQLKDKHRQLTLYNSQMLIVLAKSGKIKMLNIDPIHL